MSNNEHPITPPDELVKQWQASLDCPDNSCAQAKYIATQAANWGYEQRGAVNEAELQQARDEELEACIKWLRDNNWKSVCKHLRDARRPKPPSLKEQALAALKREEEQWPMRSAYRADGFDIIRRALNELPDN